MSPVLPSESIEKKGYISEFTLELNEARDDSGRLAFLRFTVTDDAERRVNPCTFCMFRDGVWPSDDPANMWHGLTFGSIQVSVMATIKDAYFAGKRVIVTGSRPRIGPGSGLIEVTSLTACDHDGQYLYRVEPGSWMNSRGQALTTQDGTHLVVSSQPVQEVQFEAALP